MYSKGLVPLAVASVVTITTALALVFFYAPLDADQGFVQKIFYVHVPMAIVALCGFVAGGVFAIRHLRSGDRSWDMRSYVAIHLSIILGAGRADHRRDLGEGVLGPLVALGRAGARLVPRGLPALLRLLPAALLDRGPGPPGALLVGVRDHGRARSCRSTSWRCGWPRSTPTRACSPRPAAACPGEMRLTFLVALLGMALLFVTLWKLELTAKHASMQLKRLRNRARVAA